MDSLTQMALGSAVGAVVLGRSLGWRAFGWGALLATLPDLDSLVPLGDPVADFTYHRGYTHALVIQTLVSPLLGLGLARWYRDRGATWRRWVMAVWLILISHSLLDAVTIYGTQLGLPFSNYPVGLGSLFIIDPLFTLPLLVGIGLAVTARADWRRARRRNAAGLLLAGGYLAWAVLAQQWVEGHARAALAAQGIPAERMLVTPTPFNTVLWRVVAVGDSAHWEGFYPLASGRPIRFSRYPHEPERLEGVAGTWPVQRLTDFTKGFFAVNRLGGEVVITDLRMGQAGFYAFAFAVAAVEDGTSVPIAVRRYRYPEPPMPEALLALWDCALGRGSDLIACGSNGSADGPPAGRPPPDRR